jgi:hypothetical protein
MPQEFGKICVGVVGWNGAGRLVGDKAVVAPTLLRCADLRDAGAWA